MKNHDKSLYKNSEIVFWSLFFFWKFFFAFKAVRPLEFLSYWLYQESVAIRNSEKLKEGTKEAGSRVSLEDFP